MQTYGQEELEMEIYNKHLERTKKVGIDVLVRGAFGYAILMGLVFAFYSYALYIGGWLRYSG